MVNWVENYMVFEIQKRNKEKYSKIEITHEKVWRYESAKCKNFDIINQLVLRN